jgi:arabinosyltransferase C
MPEVHPRQEPDGAVDQYVVGATLLLWWIVGPTFFDDGWVFARVLNFPGDHVFANYYGTFNAALPTGFLYEFGLSLLARVTDSLLWLRMPALVLGFGAWLLIRRAMRELGGHVGRPLRRSATLAAAGLFLATWLSWGNTLRAEPIVAFLIAASIWATVRFVVTQDGKYLLIAGVVSAASISTHPSGIIVVAPLLAALPSLVRWIRTGSQEFGWSLAACLTGLGVLALSLFFVGDAEFWNASRSEFLAADAYSTGFGGELGRYGDLFTIRYSSGLRRLSVLLMASPLIMFSLRPRSSRRPSDSLPAVALLLALLLLFLTPSKWIWHFGAIAPLAVAAVGFEAQSWLARDSGRPGRPFRDSIVALVGVMAPSVAWMSGFDWETIEIGQLGQPESNLLGTAISDPRVLTAVALVVGPFVHRLIRRRADARSLGVVEAVSHSALPVAATVGVVLALFVFASDALNRWPAWSLPAQNLGIVRSGDCGLADELMVAADELQLPSARSARSIRQLAEDRGGKVLIAPQLRMFFPCLRQPEIVGGLAELPTIVVASARWPLVAPGSPHAYLVDVANVVPVSTSLPVSTGGPTFEVLLVEPILHAP